MEKQLNGPMVLKIFILFLLLQFGTNLFLVLFSFLSCQEGQGQVLCLRPGVLAVGTEMGISLAGPRAVKLG